MSNLNTRVKILMLVAIALLVAITLGGTGKYYLDKNIAITEYRYKNYTDPLIRLNNLKSAVWLAHATVLEMAMSSNPQKIEELDQVLQKARAIADESLKRYELSEITGEGESELRKKMAQTRARYAEANAKAYEIARLRENVINKFNDYLDKDLSNKFRLYTDTIDDLLELLEQDNIGAIKKNQAANETSVTIIMTVILLGSIVLLSFGFYMSGAITRVLSAVTAVALSMADNDLTKKVQPELEKRRDEFGDLARALNQMQKNLIDTVKNLGAVAENIAASSEELNANAEQTANSSGEVANATSTIMQATEHSLKTITDTVKLIETTAGNLKQVAETANAVALTAGKTAQTSHEGRGSVEIAVASINAVGNGTAKITEAVSELKESSHKISEIVEMITNIASQTNLLALNAAIEAARAGEHGRGFAVVAEEVRKLAEESGKAAHEIDELIAKNTQSIQHTVSLMDEQRELVGQGVEKVNNSGQAFVEIASLVDSLSGQVQNISVSVHKMAEDSDHIVAATRDINSGANTILSEVTNVSSSAEEQAASTEEIASSSQMLAKMAEDLTVLAAKFKY
ncbi:MAG: methyl-accepting chemotaxis protein [Acidaminococcales bacterium]|jgi:methyl-accepting chemotaxis protein|nr:methyl-accepting chemotaxis protein [Acidaminococcales bacterium]